MLNVTVEFYRPQPLSLLRLVVDNYGCDNRTIRVFARKAEVGNYGLEFAATNCKFYIARCRKCRFNRYVRGKS